MDCSSVRPQLLDYQRGQLDPEAHEAIRAHVEGCAACAREEAAEQALTELLEQRLPQHAASVALKRRLAEQWSSAPPAKPSWWSRWGRSFAPAFAVALVLLTVAPLYYRQMMSPQGRNSTGMIAEAVNDHLRILSSQHPLDIQSGNMHQVKPSFQGRLDFAPVVPFLGDEEFPLQGGAVGYYIDRKAAVFVFQRRLHTTSLFVFRAEGLPWPTRGLRPVGPVEAYATTSRGFNVLLWERGELGYALVSDVDAAELSRLAAKLAGA